MSAGDPAGFFLAGHFKRIADYLHAARTGNKAAAEGHIMGQHMFNASVSVFNIFTYNSDINGNTGFTENSIHAMQGPEIPFIGKCIPGFSGSYIDTFNPFSLGGFHRAFKKQAQGFDTLFGFGGHPVVKSLIKYPFSHIYVFILEGYFVGIEYLKYGFHDFRADSVSFGYCYFHDNSFYSVGQK